MAYSLPFNITPLTPVEAVIDAMYRAVTGIDQANLEMFKSAMTEDSSFVMDGNAQEGLDTICENMFKTVAPLDTNHFISNPRVNITEDTAQLTCSVLSQHFEPGQGTKGGANFMAGSFYLIDLVKAGDIWKIKKWDMKIHWTQGDYSVMTSGSRS